VVAVVVKAHPLVVVEVQVVLFNKIFQYAVLQQ
jgi:hypothetical protein